jgi:hypothetical protein
MAILKDPLFGKLSGRLGDYVFKSVNGKTVICYMPKKEKISDFSEKTHKSLLKKFINRNKPNR